MASNPGLVIADPGLPRPNPTQPYWQDVAHPLAEVQSSELPASADYTIIGSGITGLSVAKTLLENNPNCTVTVLEARKLCSGATGRNGGQLAPNAGEEYMSLSETYGPHAAGKIVRFTFRNIQEMRVLARQYAPEESELQDVQKLRVFETPEMFDRFQSSIALLEKDHPDLKGLYTILDQETVLQKYGIHGASGGALVPAGTLWPYRLVTKVWAALVEKYSSRLSIETSTPVTAVSGSGSYTVHTPRGYIQTANVVYCTNGHTGHLLPALRGHIYPFKGTMTVQDPGNSLPNQGSSLSWGLHYPISHDPETDKYASGLFYLAQSVKTGFFYFGGERTLLRDTLSPDDSTLGRGSLANLQQTLPAYFGRPSEQWKLVSAWSGIMGFSSDGLPVVGRLPLSITRRSGNGEWIAAAFNGYGMANCLLAGEALARMMLGDDVSAWFPETYLVDEERVRRAEKDLEPTAKL
ncbi:hypothetical protein ASPZODRAFT_148182 [Penicilliopsis zonata CBS 506.65]|uniref:FAD dependent oxidoreductase domain-containing protein n=1 Tax=Penicilliopsis zonata CBS 506.65 TaxID=1073090 RepID=A0A1L9SUE9_9EURO|nr:hypothetical protein ASPZODRAFT_148182 [Penicilliopsis zonata CBS 506.65]OJJ50751.1 hypothetical protein ASPZODRAFT_148182 [Penicilliopsis zonata CBS 506.65]